jgi:DNA-directed RNA polymerase specialized sigma24 family protein
MPHPFPDTRKSIVAALVHEQSDVRMRAFDMVVRAYRAPVLALLARRWRLNDANAEDLAQEFFTQALMKEWLSRYDASKGRFRTFLRSCLFAFVSTHNQSAERLKRGGGVEHVSLNHNDAASVASDDASLDDFFEQEWRRSILDIAIESLAAQCTREGRGTAYAIFRRYLVDSSNDDERPTYAQLAAELGIPVTQVTNHLRWARQNFRTAVMETLRALAGSDEEFRADVRALTGTSP